MRFRWEQIVVMALTVCIAGVGTWAIDAYLWERKFEPVAVAVTLAPTVTPSPTPIPTPDTAKPTQTLEITPTPLPTPIPAVLDAENEKYTAEGVSVQMRTFRYEDSTVHMADILIEDMTLMRAGLAKDTFGSNMREKTSEIAIRNHAVVAVSGDYYSFDFDGIIVRNGTLYINDPTGGQMAAIFLDGSMRIYNEDEVDVEALMAQGLWQTYSFGPGLVIDGVLQTEFRSSVKSTNPRCAIGMIEPGHFVFVTVDGRLSDSEGLDMWQLADLMYSRGCTQAYNLDGGGSATMVFNDALYNRPSGSSERDISDILYIAKDPSLIPPETTESIE